MKSKGSGRVVVNELPPPPDLPPHLRTERLFLMDCRNCGAEMRIGTQCGRCGAWCR